MPSENGLVRNPPARATADRNPDRTGDRAAERSPVDEVSSRLRPEMIAVTEKISFAAMLPIAEEDLRNYIHDPVGALPPLVCSLLPKVGIVLAPYLEKGAGKAAVVVTGAKPAEAKLLFSARAGGDDFASLFFTVRDEEVSDYHYYLYEELAALLADRLPEPARDGWQSVLREELSNEVHGEVDEESWNLKQALLRKPLASRKDGKAFREYAKQSFQDTMTLYLHGICCDIDVETGPRQLPSRHLRKRLEALKGLFPPPEGLAVFPEDLSEHRHRH